MRYAALATVLVVALAACAGGQITTIVRTDGSIVVGRLVEQRPDAVVVELGDETRLIVPRGDIASIHRASAAEIAAMNGSPPPDTTVAEHDPGPDPAPGTTDPPPPSTDGSPPETTTGDGSGRIPAEPGPSPTPARPRPTPDDRPTSTRPGVTTTFERDPAPHPTRGPTQGPGLQRIAPFATLPAATILSVALDAPLASDTSRAEEEVHAVVRAPVVIDGSPVVPAGTRLSGSIVEAVASRDAKGRGRIVVRFHTLVLGAEKIAIDAPPLRFVAPVLTRGDAKKIGVGAAIGGFFGRVVSGTKKGLGIGAAAGAGSTAVAVTLNNEMRLAPGTAMRVRLAQPAVVPLPGASPQ